MHLCWLSPSLDYKPGIASQWYTAPWKDLCSGALDLITNLTTGAITASIHDIQLDGEVPPAGQAAGVQGQEPARRCPALKDRWHLGRQDGPNVKRMRDRSFQLRHDWRQWIHRTSQDVPIMHVKPIHLPPQGSRWPLATYYPQSFMSLFACVMEIWSSPLCHGVCTACCSLWYPQ